MKTWLTAAAFALVLVGRAEAQDYAILGPDVATALASARSSETAMATIEAADEIGRASCRERVSDTV